MIPERKCVNCAAFDPDKKECRRRPPPWPAVQNMDWCLEWVQIPLKVYKNEKLG